MNVAGSVIIAPLGYLENQAHGLATRPFSHVMDTLAQVPVVEIPVDLAAKASGRAVPWGQRGKGFLMLGGLNESIGRLQAGGLIGPETPVLSPGEAMAMPAPPRGPFVVDASDIVRAGSFGLDLGNPWIDYSVGWLDPMGAHSDFKNARVQDLLTWFAVNAFPGEDFAGEIPNE